MLGILEKLKTLVPRRAMIGMLSGLSKIAASVFRSAAKRASPNFLRVAAFCASTQASARSPSISSSHR